MHLTGWSPEMHPEPPVEKKKDVAIMTRENQSDVLAPAVKAHAKRDKNPKCFVSVEPS